MLHIKQLTKILTLPFSDINFLKKDYLEEVSALEFINSRANSSDNYLKYWRDKVLSKVRRSFFQDNLLRNYDEIDLLLQKFYPPEDLIEETKKCNNQKEIGISLTYFKHLAKISKSFLSSRDGRLVLKYWKSEHDNDIIGPYSGIHKIKLWHSLNQAFSTDILLLVYLVVLDLNEDIYLNSISGVVPIEDMQLEQILNKGMAETHLHINAGGNFESRWVEEMHFEHVLKSRDNNSPEYILKDGSNILNYIKTASCIRVLLSLYLKYEENLKINETELYLDYKEFICATCNSDEYHNWDLFKDFKISYNLTEKDTNGKDRIDILNSIWNKTKNSTVNCELKFQFEALKYMKTSINTNVYDPVFCKLFWKYIRIKNIFYSNVIQNNSIKGLDYFTDSFGKGTQNANSWQKGLENAIKYQLTNKSLRKLELRLSIGNGNNIYKIKKSIKQNLVRILKIYKSLNPNLCFNNQLTQIGFVFHFIKNTDENALEKCWSNFKEQKLSCDLKFSNRITQYKKQIEAINELRAEIPELSRFIVGIDAASVEHNAAPWVFAPVYQFARDSRTVKPYTASNEIIKNLGFTYHVGEDFRHLVTGLRHIDEVISHFGYHAGDRIGHGIALGLDAEKWIIHNNVVILPRGEHLENLLWIWGLNKKGSSPSDFDQGFIELQIMELAEEIYIDIQGITVFALWQAYQNKFKQYSKNHDIKEFLSERIDKQDDCVSYKKELLFCKYVSDANSKFWTIDKLTLAQHCKTYLTRFKEPIQVEVKKEFLNMIKSLQEIVAKKISREGIVIETNPTSNVTIGNFDHIFEHFILNLNNRGLSGNYETEKGLLVTINTDDPIIFNTNLSNEFAYIFYALQDKGYAREDILLWIDKIRANGLRTSFIVDRDIIAKDYMAEIDTLISNLLA